MKIGKNFKIAEKLDLSYDKKYKTSMYPFGYEEEVVEPVVIENDVIIGNNVVLETGTRVKNGSIVLNGSFVNEDFPEYSVIQGNPARQIDTRFDSTTVKKLLEIKWWNWSDEKIWENREYLNGDISEFIKKFG